MPDWSAPLQPESFQLRSKPTVVRDYADERNLHDEQRHASTLY